MAIFDVTSDTLHHGESKQHNCSAWLCLLSLKRGDCDDATRIPTSEEGETMLSGFFASSVTCSPG